MRYQHVSPEDYYLGLTTEFVDWKKKSKLVDSGSSGPIELDWASIGKGTIEEKISFSNQVCLRSLSSVIKEDAVVVAVSEKYDKDHCCDFGLKWKSKDGIVLFGARADNLVSRKNVIPNIPLRWKGRHGEGESEVEKIISGKSKAHNFVFVKYSSVEDVWAMIIVIGAEFIQKFLRSLTVEDIEKCVLPCNPADPTDQSKVLWVSLDTLEEFDPEGVKKSVRVFHNPDFKLSYVPKSCRLLDELIKDRQPKEPVIQFLKV